MYLGYRNQSFVVLIFCLLTILPATGQNMHKHKFILPGRAKATEVSSSDNSISIKYSISELNAESAVNEHGEWYRIDIPGHIKSADPGKPEVPVLTRLISMPEGYTCRVKIIGVKSERLRPALKKFKGSLYPAQESETKNKQQAGKKFVIDKSAYSSKDFIKSDTVIIEALGKSRGTNISSLSIYPVRYNPGSNIVDVITGMTIEIVFTPSDAATKSYSPVADLFSSTLGKGILNYDPDDYIPGYSDKPVRMVILTDTAFVKALHPFIEWKTQKGFRIDLLYYGAEYAGSTYTELKSSLTDLYNSSTEDNPPPEYLLIIGDVNRIPYYGTGSVTDLYYGEFDGNGDYLPEMFIGRLPVADTNDVKAVVSKIVQYEKFQYADTNLFHSSALATAGVDDSHDIYMNGQVNYLVSNYLGPAENITEYNFLYPDARKDSIIKLINQGLSFINYTGHGSSTGWLYLNITNSDIADFGNKEMYPFIISNACQTSSYNTNSFGNSMVLANEKGGIGFIGCSGDSYWDEDYYWAVGVGPVALEPTYESTGLGALDRLFHTNGENASEWYFTMGQVNYAGNLSVSSSTSSRKKYYWETYNLVGDPSIIPVIGTPDTFNISLPDTLPNGLTSYSFIAEPFSYVAVSHFDTLWDAMHTSPSGSVTLEMPGLSDDSCLVVITGQNRIPLIKTIYFSEVNSPFPNLAQWSVNDSLGNSDGKADFNETIFLRLEVENPGAAEAEDVTASISTTSEYINLTASSAFIGSIAPGSGYIVYDDLSFKIQGDVPDNHTVTFDMTLRYGTEEKLYKIDVLIHAPLLFISHYLIDDTEYGNGNFIAEAGERLDLIFSVVNQGGSSTSGIFSISSDDPEITIIEPTKNSGILNSGEATDLRHRVRIAENTPTGTTINVSTFLNCDPFYAEREFSLKIGRIRETFESASFKVFPWINVSPEPWIITETDRFDGVKSARSGNISDNGSSTLGMKVVYIESDTLRFYYKVSSERNYDNLIFRLNGEELMKSSGDVDWTVAEYVVEQGLNTFEWTYKKDGSVSEGSDCAFVDLIDFAGSGNYIFRDVVAARLVSPVQKTNLGRENVTVRLLNHGPDTIEGFNLAYSLNGSMPVVEHFDEKLIYDTDSLTVTFTTPVNLSHFGDYEIIVYSFGNNDNYLLNDTLKASLQNTNIEGPVLVYPNPFSEELNIIIKTDIETTVKVSVISSEGKMMKINNSAGNGYYFEKTLIEGSNLFEIRPFIPYQGVYYLKIQYPTGTQTVKIVKVKN